MATEEAATVHGGAWASGIPGHDTVACSRHRPVAAAREPKLPDRCARGAAVNEPTMSSNQTPPTQSIDLADPAQVQRWLDHFGITAQELQEAVNAAGHDPHAVTEHLLNQGASAGAG
jgi:hypothetical protein